MDTLESYLFFFHISVGTNTFLSVRMRLITCLCVNQFCFHSFHTYPPDIFNDAFFSDTLRTVKFMFFFSCFVFLFSLLCWVIVSSSRIFYFPTTRDRRTDRRNERVDWNPPKCKAFPSKADSQTRERQSTYERSKLNAPFPCPLWTH